MTQFKKRTGSTIRDQNIRTVMGMIKNGISDDEILAELAMCFCPDTRTDYLASAHANLDLQNNRKQSEQPEIQQETEETATEYMKRRNKEKKKEKPKVQREEQKPEEKPIETQIEQPVKQETVKPSEVASTQSELTEEQKKQLEKEQTPKKHFWNREEK